MFMILFGLACTDDGEFKDDSGYSGGMEETTDPGEDTGGASTVQVRLKVYTDDDACWSQQVLDLDSTYWSSYAIDAVQPCEDIEFTAATTDGRCFLVTNYCDGSNPQDDPLLSDDTAANAACAEVRNTAPTCP